MSQPTTRVSRRSLLPLAAAVLAWSGPAAAQSFPDEIGWVPLRCSDEVMTDLYRDESGALDERDLVGDLAAPAGFAATDAEFVYFRLRLDQAPGDGSKLRPFAWGVAISVDGDSTNYEILVQVNGQSEQVELYKNSSVTRVNSPEDPADEPPVASYPMTTHGRVLVAEGSAYGGDADVFLDFSVPWSALEALGLSPATPAVVWAGSSSTPGVLAGDLACHDGGSGSATLEGHAPYPTVLDVTVDTDGDGYSDWSEVLAGTDPQSASSHPSGDPVDPTAGTELELEGGGGCAVVGATAHGVVVLFGLLLGLLLWVRRRSV